MALIQPECLELPARVAMSADDGILFQSDSELHLRGMLKVGALGFRVDRAFLVILGSKAWSKTARF